MTGFWTNKYSGSDLRKHILTAMTISNAWWMWSYIPPIRTNNRTVGATHSLYPQFPGSHKKQRETNSQLILDESQPVDKRSRLRDCEMQ